jgi:hypothetical protein
MCCSKISYHYFIYYILLRFITICIHSCRRSLDPGLSFIHRIQPKTKKLEMSGKRKIKLTSKSCRYFLYTIIGSASKDSINPSSTREKAYHNTILNPNWWYHLAIFFFFFYVINTSSTIYSRKKHNVPPHESVVPNREDLIAKLIDVHGYNNTELARWFVCTHTICGPDLSLLCLERNKLLNKT